MKRRRRNKRPDDIARRGHSRSSGRVHPPRLPINVSLINCADLGDNVAATRPPARPSFGAALVTIPSQVGFKFFDNDPKQTRGKRISNLPRQKLIMRDLNFLLSELAICHE
jgi:hypothetical protein